MSFWLASGAQPLDRGWMRRFDPRFWSINFPRPMMAALTSDGPDALALTCQFYHKDDLLGLIWASEDGFDHPLCGYETRRDYRSLRLQFRWQGSGDIKPLDAVFGPTLTIEGRDAVGQPRTWYVRLWNYAIGDPDDAVITLDFDALDGGFLLPAEADPVWAGDIDRLFISCTPADYDGSTGRLTSTGSAIVTISDLSVDGGSAMLRIGETMLPEHGLRMAGGYDDVYNVNPERVVRNILHTGYRGIIDHYIGMSHYFRLVWNSGEQRHVVTDVGGVLNAPCSAWHAAFCSAAAARGFDVQHSVSFELFDAHAPEAWKQRAFDGSPALTGWSPPSTLLSPCVPAAMAYLNAVAIAFADIVAAAGLPVRLQIGEPWWWTGYGVTRVPCFYDPATEALYTQETGMPVPTRHQGIDEPIDDVQGAYLDWLADKLADATAGMRDAVQAAYPAAASSLLVFTPQILDGDHPMLARVNLPAGWGHPAYDRLELEDYDFVIGGDWRRHREGLDAAIAFLGYPMEHTDYYAGFVLDGADRFIWWNMATALENAAVRGFAERYVWAYPQIMRDGFTYFSLEDEMPAGFHDTSFPITIALGAQVSPEFSTSVVEAVNGSEYRNINWSDARLRYDAGVGVRSLSDIEAVLRFFRARSGRGFAFRFRDPFDHSSAPIGEPSSALDQALGTGDGVTTSFQIVKRYEDAGETQVRAIRLPVPGSVKVAVDGVALAVGWAVDESTGLITFDDAPSQGAAITAGFAFDVPVRFDSDILDLSVVTFEAGEAPSIPLVEVKD